MSFETPRSVAADVRRRRRWTRGPSASLRRRLRSSRGKCRSARGSVASQPGEQWTQHFFQALGESFVAFVVGMDGIRHVAFLQSVAESDPLAGGNRREIDGNGRAVDKPVEQGRDEGRRKNPDEFSEGHVGGGCFASAGL